MKTKKADESVFAAGQERKASAWAGAHGFKGNFKGNGDHHWANAVEKKLPFQQRENKEEGLRKRKAERRAFHPTRIGTMKI